MVEGDDEGWGRGKAGTYDTSLVNASVGCVAVMEGQVNASITSVFGGSEGRPEWSRTDLRSLWWH